MIKAFIIAKDIKPACLRKSIDHLAKIAKKFSHYCSAVRINDFDLVLLSERPTPNFDLQAEDRIEFCLGRLHGHSESWDRFLRVRISTNGLEFESDYAGSIPMFFSTRDGFVASNIEPCTFLGSDSSLDDISPENVYGFMRYTHFIWDETAWRHIFQILPDSRHKFSSTGEIVSIENLKSIKTSSTRINLSDKKIADELFELNHHLVTRSLADAPQIVLPLSSGYDSRMILAVLASDKKLAGRTRCFTYGSTGSIEVESGKRLANQANIEWHHIDLPCKFLKENYLSDIAAIFGGSVHMHGMYQIEFVNEINRKFGIADDAVFTSGFMTGVPAGQHNRLLNIKAINDSLSSAMGSFSQSKFWKVEDLKKLPLFNNEDYEDIAESRFRKAFDRLPGDVHHKALIFDVWTRQRNFISYYPRTIEWLYPIASPHMCPEYANFFLSLNEKHLHDRKAVELMFQKHYPRMASIASNSNGISSIGSPFENLMLLGARILNRLRMGFIVPQKYRLAPFEFNLKALSNCGRESFSPLWSKREHVSGLVDLFGGQDLINELYLGAAGGDLTSYAKILTIQALSCDVSYLDEK